MNRKKLLMLAEYAPPSIGGSQTLLTNLFRHFPEGSYAIVTRDAGKDDQSGRLPCPYYKVPNTKLVQKTHALAWPALIPLVQSITYLAQRKEKADAFFLNYPTGSFLVGGYLLARRLKMPYYVFLHDLFEENEWFNRLRLETAKRFEAPLLKQAAGVFTITDMAREFYLEKHGVDSTVLLHTIDPSLTHIPPRTRPPYAPGRPFRILTSGGFYENMNLDALRSLMRAIQRHPNENLELRIVTPIVKSSIWDDFTDPRITILSRKKEEVWAELADADLLYVPLAFRPPSPAEVETVFPTKLTEYALAEAPILVHGPSHCYTVDYARRIGWGHISVSPNPDRLWEDIVRLRDDTEFRARFLSAGKRMLEEREARTVSRNLQRILGVIEE